ncbi:MAG: DNA repair protein RecO [Fimbriimonadales bacterium]|nr:MAG: DNA repair protein RecO [Fimbriimonadales bacterium]
MTVLVDALVLRRWSVGEADRRICLLTREHGKLYVLARGARKAKARTGPATEPLMRLHGQVVLGRRNNVLAQVEVRGGYPAIRSNYLKLSCALSFFESMDACLQEGDPHPETYDLACRFLDALSSTDDPSAALTWADLQLLEQIGFGMNWHSSVSSGDVVISPSAGGVVPSSEGPIHDAVTVPADVLQYLASVQDAEDPLRSPLALRCIPVLHRVWEAVADRPLRAREALLELCQGIS